MFWEFWPRVWTTQRTLRPPRIGALRAKCTGLICTMTFLEYGWWTPRGSASVGKQPGFLTLQIGNNKVSGPSNQELFV